MFDLLGKLVGAVVTGGASTAGGLTARVAAFAAAIAAIAGPLAWVWAHKLDLAAVWNAPMFAAPTVGQVVVAGVIGGAFIYLVTLLAHRAPPP